MTRYLLRFDDVCPTMRWSVWNAIETLLERFQVRPLIAVVPDNRDPSLMMEPARPDFWEWVRQKQANGWAIGLHGYQHRYETDDSGILGINPRSEFAGLPLAVQREKLCQALAVFEMQGVRVDAFVAPSHSFDWSTVQALREVGVRVISDGFSWRPYRYREVFWVPQQMWRWRWMPFGVWTICYHPQSMDANALARLERDLQRYSARVADLATAVRMAQNAEADWRDRAISGCWRALIRARLRVKQSWGMRRQPHAG